MNNDRKNKNIFKKYISKGTTPEQDVEGHWEKLSEIIVLN